MSARAAESRIRGTMERQLLRQSSYLTLGILFRWELSWWQMPFAPKSTEMACRMGPFLCSAFDAVFRQQCGILSHKAKPLSRLSPTVAHLRRRPVVTGLFVRVPFVQPPGQLVVHWPCVRPVFFFICFLFLSNLVGGRTFIFTSENTTQKSPKTGWQDFRKDGLGEMPINRKPLKKYEAQVGGGEAAMVRLIKASDREREKAGGVRFVSLRWDARPLQATLAAGASRGYREGVARNFRRGLRDAK